MYPKKTKTKTIQLFLFSIFIIVSFFAGTAAAQEFDVYDEDDFRDAVTQINGAVSDESHIILIHNDFDLTYFTAQEHGKYDPNAHILCLEYNYSGHLTIKSADEGTPYSVGSDMDYTAFEQYNYKYGNTPFNPYPFFKISGNNTTVVFEDIIFDGVGIELGNNMNVHSNNSTIKDAQVINGEFSGVRVWYADNSTLNNVSVSNCSNGVGGGVHVWSSYGLTIRDSNIVNNTAVGVPPANTSLPNGTILPNGTSFPNVVGMPQGGGIYMLDSIVDIYDTNICGNLVSGYQANPNAGGIYVEMSDLKIYGNTNISDNHVPAQGNAQTIGGGLTILSGPVGYAGPVPTIEISGNTIISNNTADLGGGIYAMVFYDIGTIEISGNAKISNNTAILGGGIYSSDYVVLQNNSSISENIASRSGGGIYLDTSYDTTISVSGDSDDTVSLSGNSAGTGGAVYISGLSDPSKFGAFEKLTADSTLQFSDNRADIGRLWNLTDDASDLTANMTYIKDNLPAMGNTTFSASFSNAYNNFDIYFAEGEAIIPVFVEYFADSTDTNGFLDSEYFLSSEGAELNESNVESFFDADWLNLYQPANYDPGQLQETLPLTINAGTALTVLYQESVTQTPTATITIEYYANSANSAILDSESFIVNEGSELNASVIESNLGPGWLNLHQPPGYETGRLQETLPLTVSGDTVLSVLYLEEDDGDDDTGGNTGSGGGGSGTGSATILDPVVEEILPPALPPQSGFESESEPLEDPAVITFLFSIAIACYLFVGKKELGIVG